jgi:hypothetical protein
MKNKFIIIVGILVIGSVAISRIPLFRQMGKPQLATQNQVVKETIPQKSSVTVTIDDGQNISTYSGIPAGNAFDALTLAASQSGTQIVTKQYDFGIFIQKIGTKESGKDMAWIYFVNGKSGNEAADKYTLYDGDQVEWKYTKPLY